MTSLGLLSERGVFRDMLVGDCCIGLTHMYMRCRETHTCIRCRVTHKSIGCRLSVS